MPNAQEVLDWMAWKDREKELKANMTNEEWLEQASTEEKAKLLSKLCKFIYNCGKKGSIPKYMYEEDFVQWLKEKHE